MMRHALRLAAEAAALGEVPVGAVVHRDGEILGRGANRREARADPTAHAEVLALRAAAARLGTWHLEGCDLVATLEPCPMCAGAAINARVARVVYAAADPNAGCCGSLMDLCAHTRFNHHPRVTGGVLAEEGAALLLAFFRSRRKKPPAAAAPPAGPDGRAPNRQAPG